MKKKDPMENIKVRELADGSQSFQVRIYSKGKTYVETFSYLGKAATWRDETKARLKAGLAVYDDEVPDGDMTFQDASDKFILSAVDRARNTISTYHRSQNHLLKYFGASALLSEITPIRVYQYLEDRRIHQGVAGSAICQELSFIRLVYEYARSQGAYFESPEKSIKRPKKNTATSEDRLERVIKPTEMVAFLAIIRHENVMLYRFLVFLLFTGMRPTEAATLRWRPLPAKTEKEHRKKKNHVGYVDFTRGGMAKVGTKNEVRFVPGHPTAIKILKLIENETKTEDDQKKEFVFIPDEHGQANRPYLYFRWAFRNCRRECNLENGEKLRDNIDFYSFRHTARSRMAECGIQDSAAETIIGHEVDKMVKVYTHFDLLYLNEEIKKLNYPWLDI